MNNKYLIPIISLALGLLVGFLYANSSQAGEIDNLKTTQAELTSSNEAAQTEIASLEAEGAKAQILQAEVSRLLLEAASGGGVNMKMMPHPETGEASVELPEVFSFDAHHAFCRVDTNKEAFIMPTYSMGEVLIEKNEFFMAMSTTSANEFSVTKGTDGRNKVIITGGLDCFTEVAKTNMTLGSRDVAEYAEYKIQAYDGGVGGGAAGDTFEFTVYFDPDVAPINYAIFGPEFTFTGDMIDGEITIPSAG